MSAALPARRDSLPDALTQFRTAIEAAGLTPPEEIEPDGKLHRFASNGKRSDDAGWYLLHGDGIPAGVFGCWRTGINETWRMDIGRSLSPDEERAHRERVAAIKREREADDAKRKIEAAAKAANIWNSATPAPSDHPYLARKRIQPHGARLHNGALLIPMRDVDGTLHSLQFIGPDGDKRFLSGGRVSGCYYMIGEPKGVLCIAEGFSTAASIHEATGHAVVCAFNAGNLKAVAQAMRERFPSLPLIVCADDDADTEGNAGLTKANEAAQAVGGLVAVPDFGNARPPGTSDFNDLAALRGLEAVRTCVESASSKTGVTGVTGVQALNSSVSGVTPDNFEGVTGVTDAIPEPSERPCFRVFDSRIESDGTKYRPGVWFFGIKASRKDGDAPTLNEQWVCSPLRIEAVSVDGQDNNFGRLIRFRNTMGRWREWAMPMELLRGAGDELRGELLAMGVQIDPGAHRLLGQYLQAITPKRRVQCALQVGWCGESFVLPDTVIGPDASDVIFQSGERGHEEYTRAGTLDGWQSEIAARAVGNPMLVLAVSASFAGPLIQRCNGEGGGLHFVGDSSTGKTTLIEAACSTWGGPNFRRSWRATANGMEGAAALFNDNLLALDEISECDPREVGAIVYALGNGRGKQRASRTGTARSVTRWKCFVVSSGERTIATHMAEGGHRTKAGQSVRLLDIPTARRFGAWDELHGFQSGAALSDAIKRGAATHHGHAGRAFLERLTRDGRDFAELFARMRALAVFEAEDGEGQDKRAASRFALLALAGELASEYRLTGWPEGVAIQSASEWFRAWRSLRGRGNDERRQICETVLDFIERHGDSRFSNADVTSDIPTRDRAGWWRDEPEHVRTYLFTTAGLREALRGFDFKRALDTLQQIGALPEADADGKRSKAQRIGGRPVRVYPVNAVRLGGEHGA